VPRKVGPNQWLAFRDADMATSVLPCLVVFNLVGHTRPLGTALNVAMSRNAWQRFAWRGSRTRSKFKVSIVSAQAP
jgi:hypothetical protein